MRIGRAQRSRQGLSSLGVFAVGRSSQGVSWFGPVSLGGYGSARRVAVRHGGAVRVGFGMDRVGVIGQSRQNVVRHGRSWFGLVAIGGPDLHCLGNVGYVMAVMERHGTAGHVEMCPGGQGTIWQGLVWRGCVRRSRWVMDRRPWTGLAGYGG